jgi:hypothetical protein
MFDRFDQAFDSAVQQLHAVGGDIDLLDEHQKTLLLVHAAQGVIDNGGLQYFFESDYPACPEYREFVDAFRRIGARDEAQLLEEAVQLLGLGQPHLDAEARRKVLPLLLQNQSSRFASIDAILCGNEHVWAALDQYLSVRDGAS